MLDVPASPTLAAAILGFAQAEREIQRDINKEARSELRPIWAEALQGQASTALERAALVPGARITVGQKQISAKAATSRRTLRGGLVPNLEYAGPEWGSDRLPQFKPRRKNGYVVGPAAAIVIRRAVGIWVRTIVNTFRDHADAEVR